MALRNLRFDGDELLRKRSKEVTEITPKITTLIEDMKETMYNENGVGLAAPQIGILKRIVVIDVGEGPIILINPEVLEFSGSQIDVEGCLSVKDVQGTVDRPEYVKIKALNEIGKEVILEGEELLARAFCHEIDHLNGILFIDKIIERME